MNLKYLKSDYVPKGEVAGFPLEVVDKMLEKQVEQYNKANVEVFENSIIADMSSGGFTWFNTKEGPDFWKKVIKNEKFDVFFEKYPKEELVEEKSPQKELPLPRVIEVRDDEDDDWVRRVVILFKNDEVICYSNAETLEETEGEYLISCWHYWREVQEEPKPEYKPFDFQDGVRVYSYLMDKVIVNKEIGRMFKVTELFYDDILKTSHINDFECEYLFNHCEFEDGSPVGVKI